MRAVTGSNSLVDQSQSKPGAQPTPAWRRPVSRRARQTGPLLILITLCTCLSVAEPAFHSLANLRNIAEASSVPLIIGVGLTFVLISGGIDLSVEGVVGLSAVATALLVKNATNQNDFGWFVLPVILLIGLAVGSLSGLIHTRLRLPSFMVTLGVWYATAGLANYIASGAPPIIEDTSVSKLATARLDTVPVIFLVALSVLVLGYVAEKYTRFGRYAYALGGDEGIAVSAGIAVTRYKIAIFAVAGCCSALAGALLALTIGTGEESIGSGDLFTVISAIIVGGTAITGGVGGVLYTVSVQPLGRVYGGDIARGGIHGVPLKSWTRMSRHGSLCFRDVWR